jgi:Family of unknown function (DUF6459)
LTRTARSAPRGHAAPRRGAAQRRTAAQDAAAARVIGALPHGAGTGRPPARRDPRGPGPARHRAHPYGPHRPPHHLFAERLLAVLSGERPVHWMLGLTVGSAYEQLVQLSAGAPFGAGQDGCRAVVRGCRAFRPRDGVVEASASITVGTRVSAMAFRLERGGDLRWRCSAVEVGSAPVRVPAGV